MSLKRKELQNEIYRILKNRGLLLKDYKFINNFTLESYFAAFGEYEIALSVVNYNNQKRSNTVIIRYYASGKKFEKYNLEELYDYLKR